jgi:nucleotide-binding universal stress UspA family protein
MHPFDRVLVPVDFSLCSRFALKGALAFAERFGATLEVLHAWEIPMYLRPDLTVSAREMSATLEDHTRREAEKCMREVLGDLGLAGRKDVSSRLAYGSPSATILAAAREGPFDLIALGTHGRTGLSHLLVGSVAERTVRGSACPVLTFRMPERLQPPPGVISRVIVPTDFGEPAAQALEVAIAVAAKYEAAITLVHAYELFPHPYPGTGGAATDFMGPIRAIAETRLESALSALRERVPEAQGMIRHGVAWKEILRCANEEQGDLIVMGTRGLHGITHALLGSVAEKVVRLSPVPVLTTPARVASA